MKISLITPALMQGQSWLVVWSIKTKLNLTDFNRFKNIKRKLYLTQTYHLTTQFIWVKVKQQTETKVWRRWCKKKKHSSSGKIKQYLPESTGRGTIRRCGTRWSCSSGSVRSKLHCSAAGCWHAHWPMQVWTRGARRGCSAFHQCRVCSRSCWHAGCMTSLGNGCTTWDCQPKAA